MKKYIINILLLIYFVIAIPVTFLLINYNDYNVTEFKKNTLIITNNTLEEKYPKSSLLLVKNNKVSDVKIGDTVIYYDTRYSPVEIKCDKVSEIITDTNTYVLGADSVYISKEHIIGNQDAVKIYPILGSIIKSLTSKLGYLLLIILPIFGLFCLEVYLLIKEIKEVGKYEKK